MKKEAENPKEDKAEGGMKGEMAEKGKKKKKFSILNLGKRMIAMQGYNAAG